MPSWTQLHSFCKLCRCKPYHWTSKLRDQKLDLNFAIYHPSSQSIHTYSNYQFKVRHRSNPWFNRGSCQRSSIDINDGETVHKWLPSPSCKQFHFVWTCGIILSAEMCCYGVYACILTEYSPIQFVVCSYCGQSGSRSFGSAWAEQSHLFLLHSLLQLPSGSHHP